MATVEELAVRVLKKIKVLGATETANDDDRAEAVQAIKDAHYALSVETVLRWTLADIPKEVEMPYVLIGAFYAADAFSVPRDPQWWPMGVKQVQAFVHIPLEDDEVTTSIDY
jgi:hypothetical protein